MSTEFKTKTLQTLKQLATHGPCGNRWYKVNLHVHGQGSDPPDLVETARAAELDLIAITDHQSFKYYEAIFEAAKKPGRSLVVLPGMEITTHEGVHVLAIFPLTQSSKELFGKVGSARLCTFCCRARSRNTRR